MRAVAALAGSADRLHFSGGFVPIAGLGGGSQVLGGFLSGLRHRDAVLHFVFFEMREGLFEERNQLFGGCGGFGTLFGFDGLAQAGKVRAGGLHRGLEFFMVVSKNDAGQTDGDDEQGFLHGSD